MREGDEDGTLFAFDGDIRQGSRQRKRQRSFRRLSILHGIRTIDQYCDRQILLGLKQTQEKTFQPRIGSPVDAAEVVSGGIATIVRELHRLAFHWPPPPPPPPPLPPPPRLFPHAFPFYHL